MHMRPPYVPAGRRADWTRASRNNAAEHGVSTDTVRFILFAILLAAAALRAADEGTYIPFELQNGVIFLHASIAGSAPIDVVLDSGTVRTTLDEAVAKSSGLDLSMKAQSLGANGMQQIAVLRDQTLAFGGLQVPEPLIVVYPLDFLARRLGHPVGGIIGIELFKRHVVEIDYPNRRLRILAPESLSAAGHDDALSVTYDRGLPLVAGEVKPFGRDPIATHFQLDTGASGTVAAFWKDFVRQHDLAAGARAIKETTATSFGGEHAAQEGRVESLRVGGIVVKEPEVRFNDVQYGDASVFGANLGSGFFEHCKVTFDLAHDRVFFETTATAADQPLATLPVEYSGGLVYVDVLVNGKTAHLAVDSAAGHPALDANVAAAVGVDASVNALNSGVNTDSPQAVKAAIDVTYQLGDVRITEPVSVVYSFQFLADRIHHAFPGVLGGALFRRYVVSLDYPHRRLSIYDPASFQPPPEAQVIPMRVSAEDLLVTGSLVPAPGNRSVAGEFSLDTGAAQADLVLWKRCTADGSLQTAATGLEESSSTSFGGTRPALSGHLAAFRLQGLTIANPSVRFTDRSPSGGDISPLCGNLGSGIFERFNVIFDAPHSRLIFQ